jgi:hypothetical protein
MQVSGTDEGTGCGCAGYATLEHVSTLRLDRPKSYRGDTPRRTLDNRRSALFRGRERFLKQA